MSAIVRGGQTTLHYLRMLKQVFKSLVFFGITSFIGVFIYVFVGIADWYHVKICFIYGFARLFVKMGVLDKEFRILNTHGDKLYFTSYDIVYSDEVLNNVYFVSDAIKKATAYGVLAGFTAVILIFILFIIKGKSISRKKILRGIGQKSKWRLKARINFYNYLRFHFRPVMLGDIPFPKNSENTHTLITGAPGTGKTVLMSDLITQVRERGDRAIIYDKMGVFTERFYDPAKGDVLLNPLDDRGANWNLLKECTKVAHFDSVAKAIIPSRAKGDPFWENSARRVLAESLSWFQRNSDGSNKAVQDGLLYDSKNKFELIIKSSGILQGMLPDEAEKTKYSIIAVLMEAVSSFKYLNTDNNEDTFSIREWIHNPEQEGFLIISSRGDQHEALKPLISAYLEIAINSLLSLEQNRNRRIWLFLDELPTLHYIPSLQSGLAESRQFGGSFVLALQLMAQLRDIYGKDKAESVSGLCRNRVVFATPDEETATWGASSLGKVEEEVIKENFSYGSHQMRDGVSLNRHAQIKNIVYPTEIMNLENLSCYIRFGNGFAVTKQKLDYEKYDKISDKFQEVQSDDNELQLSDTGLDNIFNGDAEHKSVDKEVLEPEEERDFSTDTGLSENQNRQKASQEEVIFRLIISEAKQGNLYVPSQFALKFEDKEGLKGKSGILERINYLSSVGKILYTRAWNKYGLEKTSTRMGLMLIDGMVFKDGEEVVATHFKHKATGHLTALSEVRAESEEPANKDITEEQAPIEKEDTAIDDAEDSDIEMGFEGEELPEESESNSSDEDGSEDSRNGDGNHEDNLY